MSNQRVIHQADLRTIESSLINLNHSFEHIYQYVMELQNKVQHTDQKLEKLSNDFYQYLQSELKMKQLHFAETRLIRVRQKVEKEFGHYDEIRRRATGILQAVEAGVVRDEVISQTTEELMISAPKYWLAPCLVALSAWIGDQRELAEKALQEALKRDNEKTSLFFALVTRRGERLEASSQWLERYFQLQDPFALDREVIVLMDAFSNGVFDPAVRKRCQEQMNAWLNDISQYAGESPWADWMEIFDSFIPHSEENSYTYLEQNSPTWDHLTQSMHRAKSYVPIRDFFQHIFDGEVVQPVQKINESVDQLLTQLVTGFDDDELATREEDRRLSLIIEAEGDQSKAEQQFEQERSAWKQKFHFKDVLKTLSFFPQTVKATKSTQRFAIAFSKDWIKKAYRDYVANNRKKFPTEIKIKIENWEGVTRDGSNQEELVQSLFDHLQKEIKSHSSFKVKKKHKVIGWLGAAISALGLGLSFFFAFGVLLFLIGLIGPIWLLIAYFRSRRAYKQYLSEKKIEGKNKLLACLAEIVDWREEYRLADQHADEVTNFLDGIYHEQVIQADFDQARIL